jgi:putative transposase
MSKQFKAYKFRLYPNKNQRLYLKKAFDNNRFIYNYYLNKRIKTYEEEKKTLNYYDCANSLKDLKKEKEWLKDTDSISLQQSLKNLDKAFKNFFRGLKQGKKNGFPKFKSKHNNYKSFTTINQKGTVHIEDKKIKIPKLKSLIKIKQHRKITGLIKSCTLIQTPSGKYFIALVAEEEIEYKKAIQKKLGIDVGLKEFAVTSDNVAIKNPRYLRKSEKRLKFLQKSLSRKKKGTQNRRKARLKVAKQHEKITNQRKDFLHKISSTLINENQVIAVEDLKVSNMVKNHKLAKSISDASWYRFREYLRYKAEWYGRELVEVSTFFPSSQICSCCGNKSSQTKDCSVRTYKCLECGLVIDRDYNAALNLLSTIE